MRVFVVTPYFNTSPEWLARCHASVREQTMPATHVLVCDGSRPEILPGFNGVHIILRRNYADYGNTPRLIGCYQAVGAGAEAIAFLDADNWYQPDHLETLVAHAKAERLAAVCSARTLHRLDGSPLGPCPHVDGNHFVDTSCLLVMEPALRHLLSWVLEGQEEAGRADQYMWRYLREQGMRVGFLNHPSVAYRTRHRIHYELAGEAPPAEAVNRTDLHGARYH